MVKRILKFLALLLALAALIGGAWYLNKTENEDVTRIDDLYALVEPLQKERDELTQELNSLDINYALEMRDISTVQVLFRELRKEIFEEAYPIMRERGVTGMLGLNWLEFPGGFNRLTLEQYNRLLRDGWGSCLLYDGESEFGYWYRTMKDRMSFYEMEMPTTVYMGEGIYSEELDEVLVECGITTVIYSAEDGHSRVVELVEDPIWHTGAMPWNYTGLLNDLEALALTNGGNLVLTVSFEAMWDAFEPEYFATVMDMIGERLEKLEPDTDITNPLPTPTPRVSVTPEEELLTPVLRVMNVVKARETHRQTQAENARLEQELQQRRTEIETKIDELDQQSRELYRRWNMSGSLETST